MVLAHLMLGKSLTPIDALREIGTFRLGARVLELRQAGYNIITDTVTRNGKRFASYRLAGTGDLFGPAA